MRNKLASFLYGLYDTLITVIEVILGIIVLPISLIALIIRVPILSLTGYDVFDGIEILIIKPYIKCFDSLREKIIKLLQKIDKDFKDHQ